MLPALSTLISENIVDIFVPEIIIGTSNDENLWHPAVIVFVTAVGIIVNVDVAATVVNADLLWVINWVDVGVGEIIGDDEGENWKLLDAAKIIFVGAARYDDVGVGEIIGDDDGENWKLLDAAIIIFVGARYDDVGVGIGKIVFEGILEDWNGVALVNK